MKRKNSTTKSRNRTEPRSKGGTVLLDTYMIGDEYGVLGKNEKDSNHFGYVVSVTDDLEAFRRSGEGYTKWPNGKERKASDRKNTDDDRMAVLSRTSAHTKAAVCTDVDKSKRKEFRGSATYRDVAVATIRKALKSVPRNEAVHIIVDEHSAWRSDCNITRYMPDDQRIHDAEQRRSSKDQALATHDYVTYAAKENAEGNTHLWKSFKRRIKSSRK